MAKKQRHPRQKHRKPKLPSRKQKQNLPRQKAPKLMHKSLLKLPRKRKILSLFPICRTALCSEATTTVRKMAATVRTVDTTMVITAVPATEDL